MTKTAFGLSNNQLKIVAMVTMLIDHIGVFLLPDMMVLRIIGRISFPIFAYMIAEGCAHTKSRSRYFAQLMVLALGCQSVMYLATGSLWLGVLITFSLSVALIFATEHLREQKNALSALLFVATVGGVLFLFFGMPRLLPETDYDIDYKIWGALLPVAVYFMPGKPMKLLATAVILLGLVSVYGSVQLWAFLALPLLALYNGTRGRWNIKYLFYIFYPAHMAVLYGIQYLMLK